MPTRHETHIRKRADEPWERDGKPHGRAAQHWLAAERELDPRSRLPGWSPEHAGHVGRLVGRRFGRRGWVRMSVG